MTTVTVDFGNRTTIAVTRHHDTVDWVFTCPMVGAFNGCLTADSYDFIDDWAALLDAVAHILENAVFRGALIDANMLAVIDRWYRFHTATPVVGGSE